MAVPSLFHAEDFRALRARVRGLAPAARAQWGRMDAAQMLAHLRVALRVAVGEEKLRRVLIGVLFGGMAKKSLLKDRPFAKGLPTDRTFVIRDRRDFATERDGLLEQLDRVARLGPAAFTTEPHPFFGRLTTAEWDALTWKHVDHHLRQFGA
jgi:hypothetical protein